MRLWPKNYVGTMANGHLQVDWPEAGPNFFALLAWWLRLRHGLQRRGDTFHSPCDQAIFPDFVGADFRLSSGWDNWSGYYLLAEDDAGDRFLARIFARGIEPRPFVG